MEQGLVVTGRLVGPTTVELDEPVLGLTGSVEIILRALPDERDRTEESIFDFLRRLPPGTRTKEDVDRQIREERDSWGDR